MPPFVKFWRSLTMKVLLVKKGPEPLVGKKLPLDREIMVLGRNQDADIVLESQAVSRRHVKLMQRDGELVLDDLGSRHGVLVNGERVTGSIVLASGDELKIADVVVQYLDGELTIAEGEDE